MVKQRRKANISYSHFALTPAASPHPWHGGRDCEAGREVRALYKDGKRLCEFPTKACSAEAGCITIQGLTITCLLIIFASMFSFLWFLIGSGMAFSGAVETVVMEIAFQNI